MSSLRILLADDQIPPTGVAAAEFRAQLVRAFGDSEPTRRFIDQCAFMGQVAGALRDAGYKVTTARTYDEALEQAAQGEFDLAIVDLGW